MFFQNIINYLRDIPEECNLLNFTFFTFPVPPYVKQLFHVSTIKQIHKFLAVSLFYLFIAAFSKETLQTEEIYRVNNVKLELEDRETQAFADPPWNLKKKSNLKEKQRMKYTK